MKTDEQRRLTHIRVDEASEAIRKTESPTTSATVAEAAHEIAATAAVVGMLAIVAAAVAAEAVAASAIPQKRPSHLPPAALPTRQCPAGSHGRPLRPERTVQASRYRHMEG
jgi:hypothetical protein